VCRRHPGGTIIGDLNEMAETSESPSPKQPGRMTVQGDYAAAGTGALEMI